MSTKPRNSQLKFNSVFIPDANNTYDIGTSSLSWVNAFIHAFKDGSGVVSLDAYNRALKDSAGTNILTWGTANGLVISGNLRLSTLTISTVPYINATGDVTSSAVTPTELGYVSGVTSAIQTQINSKAADSVVIKKDGSVAYMANQSMGSNKLTGLAAGTTAGDSVRYEQAILASGVNAFTADQSMGSHKLTNVTDPAVAQDAATKNYVDTQIAAIPVSSGGINFIDSVNRDAESPSYTWATYNDSAAIPVDLTGGTASALTFSRSNTAGEVLNGSYSYKLVKSASNAQGQGISAPATVPPAYQGKDVTITLPFYITSGSLVEGDLQVYIYDVTNSVLITPQNLNIVGKQGTLTATFPTSTLAATPANQTIRIGIHFASSSASALTIVFDDVAISPQVVQQGAIVTDWTSYTPSFVGFGTPTNVNFLYRRNGGNVDIIGKFTLGTTTAVTAQIGIPSGLVSSSTIAANSTAGTCLFDQTTANVLTAIMQPSVSYFNFGIQGASFAGASPALANTLGIGQNLTFQVSIPIQGWNSNITIGSSSTYRISSYLANGTRVTGSAPTKLGEYRSYLRNASSNTYTETNGAPATPPNATDGIKLYIAGNFSSAEPANQPSKYDIFVGKNKNIKAVYYTSPGFTGPLSPDCFQTATVDCGYETHYDNSTGVVTIIKFVTGDKPTLFPGHNQNSDFVVGTAYVDIIVSENALAVGMQKPRSTIRLKNALSYPGSTETQVRKFQTVVESTGSAITYTAGDSSNGDKFTINEDGVYSIHYADGSTVTGQMAITKNAPTSVGNLNPTNASVDPYLLVMAWTVNNNDQEEISTTVVLKAGDVIKCQTDGGMNYAGNYNPRFTITKVSD